MAASFIQNLEDSSQESYPDVLPWNVDEDSFEVSEVANAVTGDINLADALNSIHDICGYGDVHAAEEYMISLQSREGRSGSVKDELRTKIQTRRVSEGVGELQVSFEPPKAYPVRTNVNCYFLYHFVEFSIMQQFLFHLICI